MTAAYLDPFAHIVGLNKPANKSAVILPVFPAMSLWGVGSYQAVPTDDYISEPSMTHYPWYRNFQADYTGEMWLFLVPKLTSLSSSQRIRLAQNSGTMWYPNFDTSLIPGYSDPNVGYQGNRHDTGALAYFATPEEGVAYSLQVPNSDVQKIARVADMVLQFKALSILQSSTETYVADDVIGANVPWFMGSIQPVRHWTEAVVDPPKTSYTITPTELYNSIPPSVFNATHGYDETTAIIQTNYYSRTARNPSSGLQDYLILATGTTAVPPAVSGQSQYATQRAAAASLVGSVYYSRY